jgi:hypothetical protein
MSVIYNTQYVDEKYSAIIEPNLFYDSVLQPNQTYTDKYSTGPAGGIFVHKLGARSLINPSTPAGDFSHSVTADSLIQITLNNAFRQSEKIYGVTMASVAYNKAEAELAEVVKQISTSWQASGLACLVNEGTDIADATEITESNIKDYWISMRKTSKDNKARPNFGIVSTDVYQQYLEYAGDEYTPLRNDMLMTNARGGLFYGMPIIEANLLNETSVKYIDYAGVTQTVNLSEVDIIMGDSDAFSIVNNFEGFGLVDARPTFNGLYAQGEMNTGYRVTTAARILVKKNVSSSV